MFDYVEISFKIWYPVGDFWLYYFLFSFAMLPLTLIRMNQMAKSRLFSIKSVRIAQMIVASILIPAISVGATYGIYKSIKGK